VQCVQDIQEYVEPGLMRHPFGGDGMSVLFKSMFVQELTHWARVSCACDEGVRLFSVTSQG